MTEFKPLRVLAGPLYGEDPWPLRFHTHGFGATRYNTLACSLIYNNYEFGTRKLNHAGDYYDRPSGPPPFENWRDDWNGSQAIPLTKGRTFPGKVTIEWTSMDKDRHGMSINLDELFRERLILHHVARDEVKEIWLEAKSIHPISPDILVEVNDRTVNVFMRALVATEAEQIHGNERSHFRDDLVLAWTQTL